MIAVAARRAPMLFESQVAEPTLDDVIAGVWEELLAHRNATCPICAGEMEPEYGVHALPIGGRCTECGATVT